MSKFTGRLCPHETLVQQSTESLNSKHRVYCHGGNTSEARWPEPAMTRILINQHIVRVNRHGFSEAVIRKLRAHRSEKEKASGTLPHQNTASRGASPLFQSRNWLLLRKRQVSHVPVSLGLCLPLFLHLAVLFTISTSHCTALVEQTTARSGGSEKAFWILFSLSVSSHSPFLPSLL